MQQRCCVMLDADNGISLRTCIGRSSQNVCRSAGCYFHAYRRSVFFLAVEKVRVSLYCLQDVAAWQVCISHHTSKQRLDFSCLVIKPRGCCWDLCWTCIDF